MLEIFIIEEYSFCALKYSILFFCKEYAFSKNIMVFPEIYFSQIKSQIHKPSLYYRELLD